MTSGIWGEVCTALQWGARQVLIFFGLDTTTMLQVHSLGFATSFTLFIFRDLQCLGSYMYFNVLKGNWYMTGVMLYELAGR